MGDEGKTDLTQTMPGAAVAMLGNPDFGTLECRIEPGQALQVEGGAMAYMDSGMEVRSRLMGGFLRALIRKVFGGESLFVGEYSHPQGGLLGISPAVPGKVLHRALNGETILLTAGSFLACSPKVYVGTKFGGLRAMFSGEGMFFLKCAGHGDLFFNAFGNVEEKVLTGNSLIVDTGHVVGWEDSLEWKVRGMGSIWSTLFSGEGLVLEFSGRGKVWVQTRTEGGLIGWVRNYMF